MGLIKKLLCCFGSWRKEDSYEVSRFSDSPLHVHFEHVTNPALSMYRPSAAQDEGKVHSLVEPDDFNPALCSTKIGEKSEVTVRAFENTERSCATTDSEFEESELPSYPGAKNLDTTLPVVIPDKEMEVNEDDKAAEDAKTSVTDVDDSDCSQTTDDIESKFVFTGEWATAVETSHHDEEPTTVASEVEEQCPQADTAEIEQGFEAMDVDAQSENALPPLPSHDQQEVDVDPDQMEPCDLNTTFSISRDEIDGISSI